MAQAGITLAQRYQTTRQGIGNNLYRADSRVVVTRCLGSLIYGQRHKSRTEDASDACSSLPALNFFTLDVPPAATPIPGEAATPHAPLSLPVG